MTQFLKFLSSIAQMAKVSRVSRGGLFAVLVLGALAGLTNTALLGLVNNTITAEHAPSTAVIITFAALCVTFPICRFLSQLLLLKVGTRAVYEMRMGLTRKILSVPLRHLEELGKHRIMAALTGDITTITNTMVDLPMLCMHIATVVGGLCYLGWLSWKALLFVLVFMVIGFISYQIPLGKAVREVKLLRDAWDTLFKNFDSLIDGIKELKLHRRRRTSFVSDVVAKTAEVHQRHTIAGMTVFTFAASTGQVLFFIVLGLLIFGFKGWVGMPNRVASGYALVLLYLMTPLEFIMNRLPDLTRSNIAMRKVRELGGELDEHAVDLALVPTASDDHPVAWSGVEVRGVTHVYKREGEDGEFVLGPISFGLKPGELVFLVGGNGSGKTTLAKLLTGLYHPQGGEILLDGVPVTERSSDEYRQLFSVVFTDFHLFDSLLGLERPRLDAEARSYLEQLKLTHAVRVEDGVLSTLKLSQGQRKRLALLTAYLEDRPIYLFDEWAADQDPTFKEIFYLQLLPALKLRGKTVVVISHDDRYYGCADRILKLDAGQLVEDVRQPMAEGERQVVGV